MYYVGVHVHGNWEVDLLLGVLYSMYQTLMHPRLLCIENILSVYKLDFVVALGEALGACHLLGV